MKTYLLFICLHGLLGGLADGHYDYKLHEHYISDTYGSWRDDNAHHLLITGENISGLIAGGCGYKMLFHDKPEHRYSKLISGLILRRNFKEWGYSYRTMAAGNPFDYQHPCNKKAIVYVEFYNGRFHDAYISGIGMKGVAIDVGCLITGLWLLWR